MAVFRLEEYDPSGVEVVEVVLVLASGIAWGNQD
jgi:hypothetical protein